MKNYLMKKYDLTNKEGYKIAIQDFQLITLTAVLLYILAKFNPSRKKQKQTAEELIKQGKLNGVKEMEIIMEDRTGLHLDVPIKGVNIKTGIGSEGKTIVKVTYK
ncbi:hypothetical protein HR13_07680 [Porphyromonas gulae]|uniref:hypothetical protein n=1 Tax=Porphyromonas gulae TaxID=111105 RepID=UPI0003775564|nr:hypothetical protein [Porphyromonas gulae]KGN78827.1 hypothetical protein HR13_07680 [Porphyromonas gulae]